MKDSLPPWVSGLAEEDWHFIKRLILASGSLKDVAKEYEISYPTVRIRLDRLIKKVRALDIQENDSPFHQQVQILAIEGKIDLATAKALIQTHNQLMNAKA